MSYHEIQRDLANSGIEKAVVDAMSVYLAAPTVRHLSELASTLRDYSWDSISDGSFNMGYDEGHDDGFTEGQSVAEFESDKAFDEGMDKGYKDGWDAAMKEKELD